MGEVFLGRSISFAFFDDDEQRNHPDKFQFLFFRVLPQTSLDVPEEVSLMHVPQEFFQRLKRVLFDLDVLRLNKRDVTFDYAEDLFWLEFVP